MPNHKGEKCYNEAATSKSLRGGPGGKYLCPWCNKPHKHGEKCPVVESRLSVQADHLADARRLADELNQEIKNLRIPYTLEGGERPVYPPIAFSCPRCDFKMELEWNLDLNFSYVNGQVGGPDDDTSG